MNEALGELLNLFEDEEEQIEEQSLSNINDENDRGIEKMDGKQGEEETANLTVSNAIKADKKPIRSLIPIDFGSSKDDTNSYSQKKKTDNRNSLLHSDGMSSSEDEWNRNDNA
ncbi:hypothetical protein WUBG_15829 [Wuchereria bancrofti]|nr:hypothetical protein WUBG_15829 [Wuchereria bancrofti]VDM14776.1 unnamed protein product [Wuchereria bancrofti]